VEYSKPILSTTPTAKMSLLSQSYTWYLAEELPQFKHRMTICLLLNNRFLSIFDDIVTILVEINQQKDEATGRKSGIG
jgi:hypothetical protein